MIDITTINPNVVPPEIEVLENEKSHLIKHNEELTQFSNIITVILFAIMSGGAIAFSLKIKEQKKKVKNRN